MIGSPPMQKHAEYADSDATKVTDSSRKVSSM